MKAIFDVGADDGMNGILFAFKNPKIKVFSFEPIKGSKKKIKANLKKVSTFFDIKIKNYEIINTAVSNYNGYTTFYETHYKVASSLLEPKQKKKLDKFWTQSKDLLKQTEIKGLKTKKSYKVKVIKLETFCKKKSIELIHYLHVDAQGHDLKVIEGLGKYKKYLLQGVAEACKNRKLTIYKNEKSFYELKKSLKKWGFVVNFVEDVQKGSGYNNVYFKCKKKHFSHDNKNSFKIPNNRLGRMFRRIFLNKTNFKDFFYLWIWKFRKVYS